MRERKREYAPTGFGQHLKRLREASGLSQLALAKKAGLHENALAKIERGEVEPGWPIVLKLARALGVRTAAFEPADMPDGTGEEVILTADQLKAAEAARKFVQTVDSIKPTKKSRRPAPGA